MQGRVSEYSDIGAQADAPENLAVEMPAIGGGIIPAQTSERWSTWMDGARRCVYRIRAGTEGLPRRLLR